MTTPFIEACRDAAGKYGPNACDLPHDVLGKLQALALMERHDWSSLCGTSESEQRVMKLLGHVLEKTGIARTCKTKNTWDDYDAARHIFETLILNMADDATYGEVLFELEEQHNRLTEPQDEIARDDACGRARDLKAST